MRLHGTLIVVTIEGSIAAVRQILESFPSIKQALCGITAYLPDVDGAQERGDGGDASVLPELPDGTRNGSAVEGE